ncbi:MAG: hypothetical protein Q8N13_23860 [Acidovorax sp.]|nr:hypothetical protein [Acidovorax sp.]
MKELFNTEAQGELLFPLQRAPSIVLGLRMLMLTACRPGEVRGARWVEVYRKAALWSIPAERMKMREEPRLTCPLNSPQLPTPTNPLSARPGMACRAVLYCEEVTGFDGIC